MTIFTHFTHDELVDGVRAIASACTADLWAPHLLVGIGRGGLTPAVYLSHRMGIPLVSIDHSARLAPFAAELIGVVAGLSRKGDELLFVEDINDSGKTLGELRAALAAARADMSHIRFAVLIDNVRSQQIVDYRARTIDRAVDKDWFVFPWEAMAPRGTIAMEAAQVPERLA